MENVIFNGTSTRKPMGMSEVSLTIENNKGILPTEYSDVTITRRIFRSGESEYLLNKNICRLKDITNLFMDTGIGANAYSVIELKMIETILSSKADERRVLFEEAAGVNKYKLRRRLALKKLDEVKSDLNRVNDIVSEVEKKVNSLERQAKKADKYNKITTTLRELELDLAYRELSLFNIKKDEAKINKEENFQQKIVVDSELAKIEDEVKIIKQNLNEIELELKGKRSEVSIQTEKIFNAQKHISVAEERKKSLERNIQRYKQELEELKIQLTEAEETIEDSNYTLEEISGKLAAKELEKKNTVEKVSRYKIELEEKNKNLKSQSDILLEKFKEITNKENDLSNLEKSLTTKNISIGKLNEKIQSLTNNIAKTVGFIEELDQEKQDTETKIREAETLYTQKQKEKEELEKKLNSLKERELEDKSILNGIKDKIGFIQSLIDNLEGVTKGAKALIENDDWASGNKALLAHIGNSSEEYRFAVEAALKNNLNNVLVETIEDLKNGIDYLRGNDIGKASFYVANYNKSKKKTFLEKLFDYGLKRKTKRLINEQGFIGWAKDFIQTEEKWKPFFEKVLDKTVIVENLDIAFNLSGKYERFNFATLNGDMIDKSGIVEGGSAPKLDDSLFGRKQLLENLKNEFPKREKSLAELRTKIEATEIQIGEIDLKVLSEKGKLLVNDLANIDKQLGQFDFERQKANDEIDKAQQEIQDLATESNKIDNERASLSEYLVSQKEEREKADQQRIRLENEFKNFEEEYNSVVAQQNKINLEYERFLGEKRNTQNALQRAKDSIETIEKSISKREFDISSSNEESESLLNILDEKNFELEELEEKKKTLIKEEHEIDTEYKSVRVQISEMETNQSKLRKERENLSDEIHSSEIKLNELKIKIENLLENIKEDYSVTLENREFDDLDTFDFKQRSTEVHELKQQIKNLGPLI